MAILPCLVLPCPWWIILSIPCDRRWMNFMTYFWTNRIFSVTFTMAAYHQNFDHKMCIYVYTMCSGLELKFRAIFMESTWFSCWTFEDCVCVNIRILSQHFHFGKSTNSFCFPFFSFAGMVLSKLCQSTLSSQLLMLHTTCTHRTN